RNSTEQDVLFVYRATSAYGKNSDIDILCIGNDGRLRTQRLDVFCIPRSFTTSREWLGSELAHHVANYCQWMKGEPNWIFRSFISKAAINRKISLVRSHAEALHDMWGG